MFLPFLVVVIRISLKGTKCCRIKQLDMDLLYQNNKVLNQVLLQWCQQILAIEFCYPLFPYRKEQEVFFPLKWNQANNCHWSLSPLRLLLSLYTFPLEIQEWSQEELKTENSFIRFKLFQWTPALRLLLVQSHLFSYYF